MNLPEKIDEILDELRNGGDLEDVLRAKAAILQAVMESLPEPYKERIVPVYYADGKQVNSVTSLALELRGYNACLRDIKDRLEGQNEAYIPRVV